jgi:type I restriction enzyme, S subunit
MMGIWKKVPLGEVLHRVDRFENKDEMQEYQFAGTYSFARGIFVGDNKLGSTFGLKRIQRIHEGDFIYCKIMAWEGAFGLAPKETDNCVMSGAFVVYEIDKKKVSPKFLDYYFKRKTVWKSIGSQSTGTNVRRKSLHPTQFEKATIPLPSLTEQRRIVARIEALEMRVKEIKEIREATEVDMQGLLFSVYHQIIKEAKWKLLKDVAPLVRRKATISIEKDYSQVATRSFGRGTFHKGPINGGEITWQNLYLVKSGDIFISNFSFARNRLSIGILVG